MSEVEKGKGQLTNESGHQHERAAVTDSWWIALGDKPDGPHSAAYIGVLLSKGRVQPSTLVCKVGDSDWASLQDCRELRELLQDQSPRSGPPPMPPILATSDQANVASWLTNPKLPPFANAICVYCILVAPALFVVFNVLLLPGSTYSSQLIEGSLLQDDALLLDMVGWITEAAAVTLLFLGGIALRGLRAKGVSMVKAGIILHLSVTAAWVAIGAVWNSLVLMSEQNQYQEGTGATDAGYALLGLLALGLFVFYVVALVWLYRCGDALFGGENASAPLADNMPSMTT